MDTETSHGPAHPSRSSASLTTASSRSVNLEQEKQGRGEGARKTNGWGVVGVVGVVEVYKW